MFECVVKWFILTVQACVWIEMDGDNAFVNVYQCAFGMNLHEMHLSHLYVRVWEFWIVKYPHRQTSKGTNVISTKGISFLLTGDYMEVKGVFLVKNLYKPSKGLVLANNMCNSYFKG